MQRSKLLRLLEERGYYHDRDNNDVLRIVVSSYLDVSLRELIAISDLCDTPHVFVTPVTKDDVLQLQITISLRSDQ